MEILKTATLFATFVVFAVFEADASPKLITTTYRSIAEFRAMNPNVQLIQMDTYVDAVKDSRSYTLGARQTGEISQVKSIITQQIDNY